MVFSKDRHPYSWTIEEKLKLLELHKSEPTWDERSKKMYTCFPTRRIKGFFSESNCHSEFEKIVHAPSPVPLPPNSSGYSLKTLVEVWTEHYKKEVEKEHKQMLEMCMIDIRNSYALVDRLVSGKPEMNDDQMLSLLEEARAYDAKKDINTEIVVNAYMRRLIAYEEEKAKIENPPEPVVTSIPPTKSADILPRGLESVFRSPSPMKTPIRRIPEAVREGITPIRETPVKPEPVPATPSPKLLLSTPPKMSVTSVKTPVKTSTEFVTLDEAMETDSAPSIDQSEIEPSRPPRRSEKREPPQITEEIATYLDKSERRRGRKKLSFQKTMKETPIDVEDIKVEIPEDNTSMTTPVTFSNGRGRKRGRKSKAERAAATATAGTEDESTETSITTEQAPASPMIERFSIGAVQTDISIVTTAGPHQKEVASMTARRTRNTSEYERFDSEDANEVSTQTTPISLTNDDKIVVYYHGIERKFIPFVHVEKPKKEEVDEEIEETVQLKKEGNDTLPILKLKDNQSVTVVYDVNDSIGKSLLKNKDYILEDDGNAPAKRLRKEEKSKEESIHMKSMLLNTWRALETHRHSSIFLRPVSEREAPGYSSIVKQKMDLQTLKKEIETGIVTTPEQMKHKAMNMFANAVMFNSSGYEINMHSKEMAHDILAELARLIDEGAKGTAHLSAHPRRNKPAEENNCRPTRSQAMETRSGSKKNDDFIFTQTESQTRSVFRRRRPSNLTRKY